MSSPDESSTSAMPLRRISKVAAQAIVSPHLVLATLLLCYLTLFPWYSKLILAFVLLELTLKFITIPVEIRNGGKWRVVIVGAGAAGICMAKRLKDVGINHFVVLESADGIGGTWRFNRYPGITCDTPSHTYSYSFYNNVWWSKEFSPGKEIYSYMRDAVTRFGLRANIKFGQTVTLAKWDEERKMWKVKTATGDTFEGNFLVRATGILLEPQMPEFKNQEVFKKPIFHSARWDSSIDLADKRVAVIGTGASSIQIIPSIADKVKELYLFQRTPAWVMTRPNGEYSKWLKYVLHLCPWIAAVFRSYFFLYSEMLYYFFISNRISRERKTKYMTGLMRKELNNNEALLQTMVPKYEVGCKRITFSNVYLKAFLKSNVHVMQDPIEEFTPEGITTKCGTNYELDTIVLATGFKVLESFKGFECIGKGGKSLCHSWGEVPKAYYGVTYPGFPNMFMLLGPSTILGHNSVLFMMECEVNYILDCIRKLSTKDTAASVDLREERMEKYMTWLETSLKETAWESGCFSWYNQGKKIMAWPMWPKTCIEYWWRIYSCRESDYKFE